MKDEYINIFKSDYPKFINEYLNTDTMKRIKEIGQFCGCDYTDIYKIPFFFSRYDHSLVVSLMTWHFTHDKKETIAALLHDVATPCFSHVIDCVFGDYINQESSETNIIERIKNDKKLMSLLIKDEINVDELFINNPILENKSPKLCTDRLDGVLHTAAIWLHNTSYKCIKEIYDSLVALDNEESIKELGFNNIRDGLKFVKLVKIYAKELQSNKDKYVMKYIADVIKDAKENGLITYDMLYTHKEKDIVRILKENYKSFICFNKTNNVIGTNDKPEWYHISFETKKRNVIPLVKYKNKVVRITEVSKLAKRIYKEIDDYKDFKYAYIDQIKYIN